MVVGLSTRPAFARRPSSRSGKVRRTIKAAHDAGIYCLTLYAFSVENWNRPSRWNRWLDAIAREQFLEENTQQVHKMKARFE